MSNTTVHKFISTKTQSPDPTLVSKNEWNGEHVFQGGTNGQVLSFDNTQTDNAKWVTAARAINISVRDFVTGGAGTQASPWIGWETAFSTPAALLDPVTLASPLTYTGTEQAHYHFSAGWYSTAYTMNLKKYNTISGEGQSTFIMYTGADTAIRINGTTGIAGVYDIGYCSLYNFRLVSTTGKIGIALLNTIDNNFHRIDIMGQLIFNGPLGGWTTAGVFIGASAPGATILQRFSHCRMQICAGTGVLIGNTTTHTSNLMFSFSFIGCRIQGNTGYGLYTEKYMGNLALQSCDIEGNTSGSIWADIVNGISIFGCYLEQTSTVPVIAIGSGTGGTGGGVVIKGNTIAQFGTGPAVNIALSLNVQQGVEVSNNYFFQGTGPAMKLGYIFGGMFFNNVIASGKVDFDLSVASLTGCQLQGNIGYVQTFTASAEQTLSLRTYTNVLNARTALYFTDQNRTRAKISSRIDSTTTNLGTVVVSTGDGAGGFRDSLVIDSDVAANETPLLVWDTTAGFVKRVSIGVADSGGVGFKLLRIPN